MATYAHAEVLDGGLLHIQNNATQVLLLKSYVRGNDYATVVADSVASASVSSADFEISDLGLARVLTFLGKAGVATANSGASPVLHFAFTDGFAKVLWVTKETSDIEITSGNPIVFPTLTYTREISTALLDIMQLSTPLYIGHAGNKQMYPEESSIGFLKSVQSGEIFLDADARLLSGGTDFGLMHDYEVDRTTNGGGLVSNKTVSQWQALRLDPSVWFGGGYPDTEAPPLLTDVLNNHASDALFSIENKETTAGSITTLLGVFTTAGIAPKQALISSFTISHIAEIASAGYEAMLLTGATADTPETIIGYGAGWIGPPTSMAYATINTYLAAGLKAVVWTINRRYLRDPYLTNCPGITGFFTDDSKYLGSATAIRTADNFASQTWDFGMYSADDLLTAASRGEFFAPDYWGYATTEALFRGCLMGYLCPVANPSSFVMDFKITFDSANAGDSTRWASVFIGTTDQAYKDVSSGNIGYHILFRKNGAIDIYVKAFGSSSSLLNSVSGSLIADGAEKNFRITVTATQVKAAQVDGGGADITANTVTNAASRGGYISLNRNGLACKFRDIAIT